MDYSSTLFSEMAVAEMNRSETTMQMRMTLSRLSHQFLDQSGDQFRVILLLEVFDAFRFYFQIFKGATYSLPNCFSFLTFSKIKIRDQFTEALLGNGLPILVVIFDDLLLVGRMFCHGISDASGLEKKALGA